MRYAGKVIPGEAPIFRCDTCDSKNITMGVYDRVEVIKDKKESLSPSFRPKYVYQIPLGFIPGLGPKAIEKLLSSFETEMNVLHKVSADDIEAIIGRKHAENIVAARSGKLNINAGGGGVYGKVDLNKN